MVTLQSSSAEAQTRWRYGFGYSSQDGDTVVDAKLADPDEAVTYPITRLPPACFTGDGITGVSGASREDGFDGVIALVSVTNMYERDVVIECGTTETHVNLFFEFSEDDGASWRIISNPNSTALRYVLLRRLGLVASDTFQVEADPNSENIILVKRRASDTDAAFLYGVANGAYLVGYTFDGRGVQSRFESYATAQGFEIINSVPLQSNPGHFRTVLSLGRFTPRDFFSTHQRSFTEAVRLYSMVLQITIDEMEADFRDR